MTLIDNAELPGPPEHYTEISLGMTNFDHSIDDGFAEALQSGDVYGRHAGWEFNGIVWWDGTQFRERVSRYGVPREVFSAPTLEELMRVVNATWGAE